MTPQFTHMNPPTVAPEIHRLLPEQGSFEMQNDQPGKIHNWHYHSLDEELFVLKGEVVLFWTIDGRYNEKLCTEGTWITLPAGVVHGSTAGHAGAVYMIRPEGGRTAETTFLAPEAHPHPAPRLTEEVSDGRRVP